MGWSDCLEYASKGPHSGDIRARGDAGNAGGRWGIDCSIFQRHTVGPYAVSNPDPSNVDPKQGLERPSQPSMVYELRTYTAADGKLDALNSRS